MAHTLCTVATPPQHVRIFDQAKRHQMVAELQALYQNMVPLNAKKKPSDGAWRGVGHPPPCTCTRN